MISKYTNRVWNDPDIVSDSCCEDSCKTAGSKDYTEKFIDALVEMVVESLRVSWNERQVVGNLLKSSIEGDVISILKQYLHSQLEIIGIEIEDSFGVKGKLKTSYATHAKLSEYLKAIKDKYKILLDQAEQRRRVE